LLSDLAVSKHVLELCNDKVSTVGGFLIIASRHDDLPRVLPSSTLFHTLGFLYIPPKLAKALIEAYFLPDLKSLLPSQLPAFECTV
jgi:hypothetical protein